ncbi:MAG: glycosyltransferase family 2 protein [Patescibacteria group bacterium]|jgi:glycosyltransferase involved in cell wall biosynthesis
MKISCIIPTCDRSSYLIKALESVFNQTVLPFEIIVINNGQKKLELPEDIFKKITISNTPPYIGAAQARNLGVEIARGDFLAFLDDDDVWDNNYLKNVTVAIARGAKFIVSRMDILENGKVKIFKNPSGQVNLKNLLVENPGVGGSNVVIARKLFLEIGGYDKNLITSEDKSLAIETIKKRIPITVLSENRAIVDVSLGLPGLRDNDKMAEGTYQFIKKYKSIMTRQQYAFNWYKVFRYRYKSGRKIMIIPYFFLTLFFAPKDLFKIITKKIF